MYISDVLEPKASFVSNANLHALLEKFNMLAMLGT
jgi:hypothetical protein